MGRGEGEKGRRGDSCTSHLPAFKSIFILSLVLLAIYAQTIGFGFLRFDDPDYTFACQFVKGGLSWSNVCEAFRNVRHGAVWMPLTWISYMADISLFGRGASGHHLVNVALHLANALLVLRLVFSIIGTNHVEHVDHVEISGKHRLFNFSISQPFNLSTFQLFNIFSVLAVLFWALHPQRVEAVAWIASRKELLWAFFALIGLLAWRSGKLMAALVCCALACMSKPTAMVFPLLAMVAGRCEGGKVGSTSYLLTFPPSHLLTLSLMFAISLATGALAIYSQTHPEGMVAKELFYAPLGERLLNAMVAVGLYLAQMVAPIGLHLDYRAVPGGWPLNGTLGLSVFVAAVLLLIYCLNALNALKASNGLNAPRGLTALNGLKALIFFAVALLPTLGLFASFGEQARADRFLYVPTMAVPLFVASLFPGALNGLNGLKAPKALKVLNVAFLFVIAAFAVLSFRLTATYRDDLSAFSRTLACDPDHGRALAHVGEARCAAGALDEGIELLRRSRAVRPRDATDGKLAYALMRRGRSADWDEIRAVCAPYAADPSRDAKGQALEALGTAELKARDWPNAALHLSRSILAPARFYSSADAKLKLAYAWHNGGRRTDARKLFEAISRSTRADLSAKADEVLSILDRSPNALLFW